MSFYLYSHIYEMYNVWFILYLVSMTYTHTPLRAGCGASEEGHHDGAEGQYHGLQCLCAGMYRRR
jgi:hypothetical protein